MAKLKSVIQYECVTSLKYIPIFYGIQYFIVTLITVIVGISVGTFEEVGTNALEMNSLIYTGILGVLGFKEDFKMLIQNGFTRKYIFAATVSLFVFICGIMSFVDTVMGNLLHSLLPHYSSLYGAIYGYDNILSNWIWLFLLYLLVCNLFYLVILVIHKLGKTYSICAGVGFGGIILLAAVLFRYVIPADIVKDILSFLSKAMGFVGEGRINHLFPTLTLLTLTLVFGFCCYRIIRRTEL